MNVVISKPGVKFDRILPAGFRIIKALGVVALESGHTLEITCGTEDHGPNDPHTLGEAYDVRAAGFSADQVIDLRRRLISELGAAFTVLYECPSTPADFALATIAYLNAGATAPHFHLQRRNGTMYPPIAAPTTTQA